MDYIYIYILLLLLLSSEFSIARLIIESLILNDTNNLQCIKYKFKDSSRYNACVK